MAFAEIRSDLSYWRKQEKPLFPDLEWNIPEQKTGRIDLVGGNNQGFNTVVRLAEYARQQFPFREVRMLLPDALRAQLPALPEVEFAPSTESGSFGKSAVLGRTFGATDFALLVGDLSRNATTAVALTEAIQKAPAVRAQSEQLGQGGRDGQGERDGQFGWGEQQMQTTPAVKPLLITRDAVDLLATSFATLLERPDLWLVASMAQLQKVFQAIYYPRMILLSQPLLPVIETLHKFTLSYPVTVVTFHQENVIVAHDGEVITTKISQTEYSPISLWSGRLAVKIAALNLYNLHKNLEATAAAVMLG